MANSPVVWDNWSTPGGAVNTLQGLTNSSDSTREKAGMKPTRALPARPLDPERCAQAVQSQRWAESTRVDRDGCITWTGATNRDGYGLASIGVGGANFLAHRVAHVASTGADIPRGLVIDHLCRNRACVNPEHLEAVTHQVNMERAAIYAVGKIRKLDCKRGHGPLTPSASGWRRCETCRREAFAVRRQLVREARAVLGLSRQEYLDKFGTKFAVARAIIAANEEKK